MVGARNAVLHAHMQTKTKSARGSVGLWARRDWARAQPVSRDTPPIAAGPFRHPHHSAAVNLGREKFPLPRSVFQRPAFRPPSVGDRWTEILAPRRSPGPPIRRPLRRRTRMRRRRRFPQRRAAGDLPRPFPRRAATSDVGIGRAAPAGVRRPFAETESARRDVTAADNTTPVTDDFSRQVTEGRRHGARRPCHDLSVPRSGAVKSRAGYAPKACPSPYFPPRGQGGARRGELSARPRRVNSAAMSADGRNERRRQLNMQPAPERPVTIFVAPVFLRRLVTGARCFEEAAEHNRTTTTVKPLEEPFTQKNRFTILTMNMLLER